MTEHAALPGVSWCRVVVDLEQRGFSHPRIASIIDVSKAAIESWKNRHIEPSHRKGERLLSLWCAAMGAKREEVPRRDSEALSAAAFK